MILVPEELKELFRSNSARKNFKLTFYKEEMDSLYPSETLYPEETLYPSEHGNILMEIDNKKIASESLSITEALSASSDLEFGSCESSVLEITVADIIEDLTGREFSLEVEIGENKIGMGYYTVDSFVRQSDRRKRKITAYDRMRKFNIDVSDWYNSLTFPMTIKAFRNSLCEYAGITQTQTDLILDSLLITKTIEPTELSGIDVLKSICQINGCFGHINRFGELKYVMLPQMGLYPSETLYPEEDLYPSETGSDGYSVEVITTYRSPMVYEDYLVDAITGLTIREQEGDVGASIGYDDNPYVIEGNFLLYGKSSVELLNIANAILPVISGRTYRPAKVQCNALPWVEVGDALRIPTRDDMVETFCMNRTMSGCQAMKDEFQSTGSQKREEVFGIGKQIIQLEGKTAVIIKNVDEVSAKVTDLKNYTESQFKITADAITAEVTRATAEEEKLSASIKVNAEQIALKVSKGEVSSQISVEHDKVEISGNRLIVNSTNFKLDGNGNATFSGNVTGAAISGGRMTGTHIEGGNGMFEVDSDGVRIGEFESRYGWGRGIFQSYDGMCGMSADSGKQGGLWFWAGWENASTYDFLVNNLGEVHCNELYLNDPWWDNYSLTRTMKDIYDYAVESRERIISLEQTVYG